MKISLVSWDEGWRLPTPPLQTGLVSKLLDSSPSSKKMHSHKVYGCRHCAQRPAPSTDSVPGGASSTPGEGAQAAIGDVEISAGSTEHVTRARRVAKSRTTAASDVRLWDLNGLRSHAKAKCVVLYQTSGDNDQCSCSVCRHGIERLRDEDMFRVVAKD
jgi:hypothetical protein